MEPHSFFLPKRLLTDTGRHTVKTYRPVFTHTFDDVDDANSYDEITPKEPSYISDLRLIDYGKTIFYDTNPTRPGFIMLYKSRKFVDNKLVISKGRTCRLYRYYPHRLYDCALDVCFLITLELPPPPTRGETNNITRIYVSYVTLNQHHQWELIEDACVLEYEHLFTRCSCFLSEKDQRIVIITGNYVEGFLEEGEECDSYINLLSYNVNNDGTIGIRPHVQRNVTETTRRTNINNLYFTQDGSKLILISTNAHFLLVYSIGENAFGEPFEWDAGQHNPQWYYYFSTYHKDLGNVFMICEADGKILMLRETNMNFRVLEDESLSLCDLGLPHGSFIFYHVQFFEEIVVYVTTGTPKQLFIVNCSGKKIIGKYVPDSDSNIVEVNTNWSGEEVFLLMCTPNGFVLDVLYVSMDLSLKCLSKLAVLQTFSADDLRGMNLPRMLKEELNLSLFGLRMLNSKRFGH